MAYVSPNFKTKADLKRALAAGRDVSVFQPNDMGFAPDYSRYTGTAYLEGPHYPQPHKWYAQAEMVNGKIVKVR